MVRSSKYNTRAVIIYHIQLINYATYTQVYINIIVFNGIIILDQRYDNTIILDQRYYIKIILEQSQSMIYGTVILNQ